MVARSIKVAAPGRDNDLIARMHTIAAHRGVGEDRVVQCTGFTLSLEGAAAVKAELGVDGKIFGLPVFVVPKQRERVRAYWSTADLTHYLMKTR